MTWSAKARAAAAAARKRISKGNKRFKKLMKRAIKSGNIEAQRSLIKIHSANRVARLEHQAAKRRGH